MKKPKTLSHTVSKILLICLALLLVVFSGSVLAHANENDESTTKKKSVETSRESAKLRLEGTKLKACENREKVINSILDRIAKRGERRLSVYSSIFNRVQEFYEKKNLSISNYDALVADVNAKKTAAQAAIDKAASDQVDFQCDGDDPKGVAAGFKSDLKAQINTLHDYRKSIRNLIVAIKTSLSEAAQSNSAGGVGEQ